MKEFYRNPKFALTGIVLALGGYALGEYDQHKPAPIVFEESEEIVDTEDTTYHIRYYSDNSRTVTEVDKAGNIQMLYKQSCRDLPLSDEFMKVDAYEPKISNPSSDGDYEFALGISYISPKCDNGGLSPMDFKEKELAIE